MTQDAERPALLGANLGGFLLVTLVGTGGMAEVYRAIDPKHGSEVAVKVLAPALAQDPSYAARFRSEAVRVAALKHPNIVPVYHFGEDRRLLYIVMPLLKESLRDRMDRERIMPTGNAADIVARVAAALDQAHVHGLVHRDVKPENILLGNAGAVMLTDFGIARELDVLRDTSSSRTPAITGLPVGTPEYMSPEQLRGVSADQRMDVYGLGAVFYELVTGRVPHDGPTPYEVAIKTLTEPTLRPSMFNRSLWRELEDVIMGALAHDPRDRYPNMRSFVAALNRAMYPRPSEPYPRADYSLPLRPDAPGRGLVTRQLADVDTGPLPTVSTLPTLPAGVAARAQATRRLEDIDTEKIPAPDWRSAP